MEWMVIGKWKNDSNSGSRWKPMRSWPHQDLNLIQLRWSNVMYGLVSAQVDKL